MKKYTTSLRMLSRTHLLEDELSRWALQHSPTVSLLRCALVTGCFSRYCISTILRHARKIVCAVVDRSESIPLAKRIQNFGTFPMIFDFDNVACCYRHWLMIDQDFDSSSIDWGTNSDRLPEIVISDATARNVEFLVVENRDFSRIVENFQKFPLPREFVPSSDSHFC